MKIGYVGLGALGGMLARQFLEHDLTVWDINPSAVAALVAEGAGSTATAAELARRCDIVFTCLPRSRDVDALMFGRNGLAEGLSAGKLVIDQTSGVPAETIAIASRLKERGVDMIDAAVSGSPQIVPQGGATLMVGGPQDIVERAMPHLAAITRTIQICGRRVGDGQAMKMVNNAINATNRVGMFEAVALGRKLGIPLESMRDVFAVSSAQNVPAIRMLPAIVEGRASTNFGLPLMLKDINQAISLGDALGSPMPVASAARALHQFGVNFIGRKSNLEDTIRLTEVMADATFRGPPSNAAPVDGPDAMISSICVLGAHLPKDALGDLTGTLPVAVLDPEAAASAGARSVVAGADVVILAFGEGRSALAALAGLGNALKDRIVLWISSGTREEVARAKSDAEGSNATFVDAAFCTTQAIASDSVLAWSGDRRSGARLAPVFAALGKHAVYCGEAGRSADLATLNMAVTAICSTITVECAMVGERAGLAMERMAAVIGVGSGGSAALRSILPRLASGRPDGEASLAPVGAALKRFNVLALDAGVPAFVAQAVKGVVDTALVNLGSQAGLDDLATFFAGKR